MSNPTPLPSVGSETESKKDTPPETSGNSPTETQTPSRSKRFYDDQADLEIISSDGVHFRIWAYHLQARSSVFRNLITSASPSPIELSDSTIETAHVLTNLLNLIIHGELDLDTQSLATRDIIRLARKYDFHVALKQIGFQARSELAIGTGNQLALEAFLAGAALNDQDLCTAALQANVPTWRDEPSPNFGAALAGGHTLDPSSARVAHISSLKPEVLWAWMRAYHVAFASPVETDPGVLEAKGKKMSDEFARLMELENAPKSLSDEE